MYEGIFQLEIVEVAGECQLRPYKLISDANLK